MKINFKRNFKLVDNGDLTQNLHSLCYQNNILISEIDLGNVEDILVQLKKQKEINQKAIEYINSQKYYDLTYNSECPFDYSEVRKDLLQILEDKEV